MFIHWYYYDFKLFRGYSLLFNDFKIINFRSLVMNSSVFHMKHIIPENTYIGYNIVVPNPKLQK